MAYCPEDGREMVVAKDAYYICYDCPECNGHWFYQEVAYSLEELSAGCRNCGLTLEELEQRLEQGRER